MAQKIDVVVVGGGYAGVLAANRMTQRDDVTVTLINPRARFVERIRLHQMVCGSDDAVVDFDQILSDKVKLVVDAVTQIDAAARNVTLASGDTVGYDYLVYAAGSGSGVPSVPGAAEFAYPIAALEQAERLRPALDAAPAGAAITVVGAGPSGIETAAELAEAGRVVTLVCGDALGPYLHSKGRRAVAKRLGKLGVTVLEGRDATVTAVTEDAVRLSGGREVPSAVTIWTAGFGVPDLASQSGLSTDGSGRLLTDETLTSVDDVRIVAAGDSAAPSGAPFRMGCQAAVPLGAQAADTALRRIAGEEPALVSLGFIGVCISLGRRAGVIQLARKDDTATKFYVGNRPGAMIKEYICKLTVKQMAGEARKPGSHKWSTDDGRRKLLEAERGAPAATEGAQA